MAERRGWTSAGRRWRLRLFDLKLGRALGYYGEPSALANAWIGGLWRRGHDDGAHGGTPASLCTRLELTEREWRALEGATGCWGDGSAIAVAKEQRGRAGDGYGDGGARRLSAAAAARKKSRGNAKMGCGWVRAGAGDLKARPGAAWPARTEQRRRAAVAGDTRRAKPEAGRPRRRDSVRSDNTKPSLTTYFLGA